MILYAGTISMLPKAKENVSTVYLLVRFSLGLHSHKICRRVETQQGCVAGQSQLADITAPIVWC